MIKYICNQKKTIKLNVVDANIGGVVIPKILVRERNAETASMAVGLLQHLIEIRFKHAC